MDWLKPNDRKYPELLERHLSKTRPIAGTFARFPASGREVFPRGRPPYWQRRPRQILVDLSDRNGRAPRIHVELVDFDPGPVPFSGVSDRFGRGTSARVYPDSSSRVDIDKCPLNVHRTHSVTLRMTPLQIHLEAQQNCPPRGVASRTCRTRPNAAPVAGGGNLGWRKGGLTNMAHLGRIRRAVKDNLAMLVLPLNVRKIIHPKRTIRTMLTSSKKKQKHSLGKWWW